MAQLKKVLIMAGGTGGHVFPGLAVAKFMESRGIFVEWLGTEKGLEARLVPEAHIPIHFIKISGVRGKGVSSLFLAPFKMISATLAAAKIIRKFKPDLVIGMGGFVSGPGGIASWLMGYPIIIHEQNARAGTTNRYLAKVAKRVLQAFPNTFASQQKVVTTGNPVREEIANTLPPENRFIKQNKVLNLLVMGGSLGAQIFNEVVPKMLAQLPGDERIQVLHQTGEKHLKAAKEHYAAIGMSEYAEVVPFIQDMATAYATADLVLCRSGALTVSELCAVGVGAILVPFPFATDDHQTKNASFMADSEAAILMPQKIFTPEKLTTLIRDLNRNREKCLKMAKAAYALRRVDATNLVMTACEEIIS